jgi:two-component system, OmpR family, sensor histidine kinase MtrB
MRGAASSGSTGGEARARAGDLAPVAPSLSPAEAVAPDRPGGDAEPAARLIGLALTAFRGALSLDGSGLLAGVTDSLRRRLPLPVRRVLRSVRRRARSLVARLRGRWHRSLQLRVVATTLVISAVVVAIIGFFLLQQITGGLLANERKAALTQTAAGLAIAQANPDMLGQRGGGPAALNSLVKDLQAGSGPGDIYDVVILQQRASAGLVGVVGNQALAPSIPAKLSAAVTAEQRRGRSDRLHYASTELVRANGEPAGPALAVGAPISSHDQLYYLFPLTTQEQALSLVQTTIITAGVALLVLLAGIVSLVTRWVVVPIRQAAQAASRLSAGNLDERMQARGADDLAALANSFNDMAVSLQEKLRELEELSRAQRQFVSDVSHELRTPLTTIRIAADVLFEAKAGLDPAAGRSAELLQSQLERFEALLADLLEISRHDANVATLDAESADVCDLVRRAAADAEQLAARKGTRIDFRLPPEPCVAEVDRRRVERILRNLLDNAVEHGEGRDVVVTVATDRDAVAVAVRDHGVGFGPGEQFLVFDRFWRADPARARTTGGTGLGLAIALEDARLHGGWLQAWGEPGKGSVFRLTLPRTLGQELAGSPLPLGPDEAEIAGVGERLAGRPDVGRAGFSLADAAGGAVRPADVPAAGKRRLAGDGSLATNGGPITGNGSLASKGSPASDGSLATGDGSLATNGSPATSGSPAASDGSLASNGGQVTGNRSQARDGNPAADASAGGAAARRAGGTTANVAGPNGARANGAGTDGARAGGTTANVAEPNGAGTDGAGAGGAAASGRAPRAKRGGDG